MPRSSRYLLEGYTYHLTHRCHDRRFLLKFAEEREQYREWLRIAIKRHEVSVYGYCVTSNHVHIVAHAHNRDAIARMMQLPSSTVARHLNRRKGHEGAVWEHPYQCTMIQDGQHLLNCLRYVDLNMVRTGKVEHPKDWRWCSYDELIGKRKRYCLIDTQRLLQSLGIEDVKTFRTLYAEGIERQIADQALQRESFWTESLAVGSFEYIEQIKKEQWQRTVYEEDTVQLADQTRACVVKEPRYAYGPDFDTKSSI